MHASISNTHTCTHSHMLTCKMQNGKWQMDKELPLQLRRPPSWMAGFLCTMQELWAVLSKLLKTGQVLGGAPTATPTVVWAPEVPPGPQWLMLSHSRAFATPVNDQVLIYTPESREAIVCEFLAQGSYAKFAITVT